MTEATCCCLLVWCNVLENKPSWIILKQNWSSWEIVFQPIWSFNSPKCVSSLSGRCCNPWCQSSVPSCPDPTACHHVPTTIMPSTSVCLSNPTPCLHWALVSWKPSRHPWSLCPAAYFHIPSPVGPMARLSAVKPLLGPTDCRKYRCTWTGCLGSLLEQAGFKEEFNIEGH